MRMNRWNGRRPQAGFTLLECAVAIVLVAILAAISYPYYQSYRTRIRNAQALADIEAMSALASNYWNENHAYPNSLSDINMATKLDPWGNPYAYYNIDANGKGHARKDHALNPLNSDFDLYSMGPDGQTKSQITQKESLDDLIRASDGNFYGIASSF